MSDIDRSRAFYAAALAPLGIAAMFEVTPDMRPTGGTSVGFGKDGKPFFWIDEGRPAGQGAHIAFVADDRTVVDAFHAAALAAGGTDHGAPGLRPHYHRDYYAAFVLDPDGFNVEAVCHRPAG